jgi:hypothetical protein
VVLKNTDWFWCARYDNATLDEPQFVAPSPEHEPERGVQARQDDEDGFVNQGDGCAKDARHPQQGGLGRTSFLLRVPQVLRPAGPHLYHLQVRGLWHALCTLDRTTQDKTRLCSCLLEHKNSLEKWMRCPGKGGEAHKRMLKIKTVWGKEEKGIVHPWKCL